MALGQADVQAYLLHSTAHSEAVSALGSSSLGREPQLKPPPPPSSQRGTARDKPTALGLTLLPEAGISGRALRLSLRLLRRGLLLYGTLGHVVARHDSCTEGHSTVGLASADSFAALTPAG